MLNKKKKTKRLKSIINLCKNETWFSNQCGNRQAYKRYRYRSLTIGRTLTSTVGRIWIIFDFRTSAFSSPANFLDIPFFFPLLLLANFILQLIISQRRSLEWRVWGRVGSSFRGMSRKTSATSWTILENVRRGLRESCREQWVHAFIIL